MTKNTLLNITIAISRILKISLIVGAVALTGLFVYIQIDNDVFKDQEITLNKESSIGFTSTSESTFGDVDKDSNLYTIGNLKTISLYVIYFKALIVMVLIYLSITAFEKIMLSVKSLKTFSTSNAKRFRKIGKYILVIIILTNVTILRFESGTLSKISISLTPLLCALLAFVMAEIFKEGHSLKEENDLTI